ncbi:MAG: acetate kinase [Clostridia bacterium]|nr:acetate kinase [Clostridia bacterium]
MNVLVVNAGSSSLKYQLFDTNTGSVMAKGNCERIGLDGKIEHKQADGTKTVKEIEMPNHSVAIRVVVDTLTDPTIGCIKSMSEIEAVGHRVVHGGPYFFESVLATEEVIEKLELCRDFAPLHTGAHLMGLKGCMDEMPGVPQVLVFDTAFHQTMPEEAYFYPLAYEMYEKYHIRRYGAHGTSHRFVSGEMCKILGRTEGTKVVTCHLGNGSSISAVKDGKVLDTSMGFTPLDGIEMGTRCGAIDPAIVPYIMEKEGFTPAEMSDFMNKKCGLLGVSGVSSDSRDVEQAAAEGNKRAILATKILAYQIKKFIGSYAAAMGGLDAIVFTAGLGENNPLLRERVCADLEFLGVKIDKTANDAAHHQSNTIKLSAGDSKVDVYLIPTNEELVIASDTEAIAKSLKK